MTANIVAVSQPTLLLLNMYSDSASCLGGNDGSATVTVTGGTAPYTYRWTTGATAQSINNLISGVYPVTVTDNKLCQAVNSAIVISGASINVDFNYNISDLTVTFIDISDNADSFNWDFGDGFSSILQNPSHTFAVAGTYNVCLKANNTCESDSLCKSIIVNDTTCSIISSFTFNDSLLCDNDTLNLQNTSTNASSFEWYLDGSLYDTTTNLSLPFSTAGYHNITLIAMDSTCQDTFGINVTVTENCLVWPGDVNDDGIANIYDILGIGINYSGIGSSRDSVSIRWMGHYSVDWPDTQKSGINKKFVDCNGDGKIDNKDVLAITTNYGNTHAKSSVNQSQNKIDPDLYFTFTSDTISAGDTVNAEINLGTLTLPANNVYGLVFCIEYDPLLIDSASAQMNYSNSWLAADTNTISLERDFYATGNFDVGFSRHPAQDQLACFLLLRKITYPARIFWQKS